MLAPARRRPAQEGRTTVALFWQIVIFLLVAAALGFVIVLLNFVQISYFFTTSHNF